jgi:hypothetical protein
VLLRRPTRVKGALTFPKRRRFLQILMIERSLHSAASAIFGIVKDPLCIMSRIISSLDGGSRGAILGGRVEGGKERR